jgi:hypothetical protein
LERYDPNDALPLNRKGTFHFLPGLKGRRFALFSLKRSGFILLGIGEEKSDFFAEKPPATERVHPNYRIRFGSCPGRKTLFVENNRESEKDGRNGPPFLRRCAKDGRKTIDSEINFTTWVGNARS